MNGDGKFILALVTITLLFICVVVGLGVYQETHTPKYYIDFQNKTYELREVK